MHPHFVGSPIVLSKDVVASEVLARLASGKPQIFIDEGCRVFNLNYCSPIYVNGNWQAIDHAQVVSALLTKISSLPLIKYLPIAQIFRNAGFEFGNFDELASKIRGSLGKRYPTKNQVDWLVAVTAIKKENKGPGLMHVHVDEPPVIDTDCFRSASVGGTVVAIEEGYRIFDLDRMSELRNIASKSIGYGQVVAAYATRISYLRLLGLPVNQILREAGYPSKEFLRRSLVIRYPGKHDIDWITIELINVFEKSKSV